MFWRFIESVCVYIVVESGWAKNACLQFTRFLCIRILKLLSVLFLILWYLHFLFQDAVKALNTLQTKAKDLTQQTGVKVSHFYNCCLVGLIDLA